MTVEFEIDGKKLQAEPGTMIIEAADKAGIYIPRFCYHKKLSIAANCRMCLVDVEQSGKPLPACATPVAPDMKVATNSEKALEAQRAVMEFLLINHPLDCPICDQGGECELQDLAMGYGSAYSHYDEGKRAVFNDDLGPLIDTEMTRCIHCTRCVRFGEEVAGLRELGATGRGEHMQIGTYVKHMMQSEISGNIIDLCPVGALTNKPARFTERGWELKEHPSIAAHDCVGTNIYVHTRGHQLKPQRDTLRVVPRENEAVNETWMSDRDRFSFEGLYHSERVYKPRVKHSGQWEEADWHQALTSASSRLQSTIARHSAQEIGALVSPNATVEEAYLLQKIMRTLGSHNVDHRVRTNDFSDQQRTSAYPNLGMPIEAVEKLDTVLLVGSNIRAEQPMLAHRVNKAFQNGAAVMSVNPVDYDFIFDVKHKVISHDLVWSLAEIAKALGQHSEVTAATLANVEPSQTAQRIADRLQSGEQTALLLGAFALDHPQASQVVALARFIAQITGATFGELTHGANAAGAWVAGAVPHREVGGHEIANPGLDAKTMLTQSLQAYVLFGLEPEFDSAYSAAALETLENADCVICITPYVTKAMQRYADIILPITPFTETGGTFINVEGAWQTFFPTSVPHGDSRPGWKVLRVLANFLQMDGFDYKVQESVLEEVRELTKHVKPDNGHVNELPLFKGANGDLLRVGSWPMYSVDNVVRRASALQATQDELAVVKLNPVTAQRLQLTEGQRVAAEQNGSRIELTLQFDDRLAENTVCLPSGLDETAGFGESFAPIQLTATGVSA